MTAKTIIPAPCLPLDLADIRQHVKQDIADDDAMLSIYLSAAVDFAQHSCSKQFVSAKLSIVLSEFPVATVKLLNGPVIAIEAIQYYDTAGSLQTLSNSAYTLDSSSHIALIDQAPNTNWPATQSRSDAVKITYYAGYVGQAIFDATANSVTLKNWPALAVNDMVRFSNSGGSLPAVLAEKTDYYIKSIVSTGVYTLAASAGGVVIDITSVGTGLQFCGQPGMHFGTAELPGAIRAWLMLRVAGHYEHRGENTVVASGKLEPLPFADRLLDSVRLFHA